jgi:hypothetical protein
MALGQCKDAIDTTADTTQSAIRRNGRQPLGKKAAHISLFCNVW